MRQQTYLVQRQTILRLISGDATNIKGGCGYFATALGFISGYYRNHDFHATQVRGA